MIPYARLTPGPGWRPIRAMLYYAQRLAVWPGVRRAIARLIACGVNRRQGRWPSRPSGGDCARVLGELEAQGVAQLAPLAPAPVIARMAEYFLQQPVSGPRGPTALEALGPDVSAAAYSMETVLQCPGLIELVNSPAVLEVVAAYLGCAPTLSSLGVRWAFPATHGRAVFQSFHRDVDDWRFLKLFIYLTDVDEGSGPHTYVRTSHQSAFALRAQGYDRAELSRRFGAARIDEITGARGTTFLADTLGVHRGGAVRTRPRLILQAQYSILPVFAFDYRPIALLEPSVDPYCNRLLFRPPPPVVKPFPADGRPTRAFALERSYSRF